MGRAQMRPKNTGPFDEAAIAVMARDTLVGLKYMHKDMLIHRDIKGKRPSPFPSLPSLLSLSLPFSPFPSTLLSCFVLSVPACLCSRSRLPSLLLSRSPPAFTLPCLHHA